VLSLREECTIKSTELVHAEPAALPGSGLSGLTSECDHYYVTTTMFGVLGHSRLWPEWLRPSTDTKAAV
jgi:hypothetical protein